MADFVQTMKDWRRMCNSVPGKSEFKSLCSDKESGYVCPLSHNGLCCKSIGSQTDEDVISGENIIASWAAEHQEPVYPSWLELAVQQGFKIEDGKRCTDEEQLLILLMASVNTPIPADIAEKLGVKPKEG